MFLSLVYAALYGVTMKIADLLNEHGLKWFTYSDILFGFAWGIFGSLLVFKTDPIIASTIVAMNIAFIVRNRLDYFNHRIAASLIIVSGIFYGQIVATHFLIFLLIFILFGSLKDYVDDVLQSKNVLARMNELMLYYPIPTFIYALLFNDWSLFLVLTMYTIFYNFTKFIARGYGYK